MIGRFKCGDRVKNTMTGVNGVIIARGNYYGKGSNKYLVEYKKTSTCAAMRGWINENKLIESEG